jgi:hypothetical protein
MIVGEPSKSLLDAVEQIHHRRRAQRRSIEQGGHVEAVGRLVQHQAVGRIVEQPSMVALGRTTAGADQQDHRNAGGPSR